MHPVIQNYEFYYTFVEARNRFGNLYFYLHTHTNVGKQFGQKIYHSSDLSKY